MNKLLKKWWWPSSVVSLLFTFSIARSQTFQNLVPNGSFESYTQCPTASSQIYYATPWTGPTTNSSEYLNACSSGKNVPHYGGIGSVYPFFLNAKTGVAYAGFYSYQLNNYREYAQVKLQDTLRIGSCYYMEFYATNGQWLKYKTNNIAACFSSNAYPVNLVPPGIIPNIPQHITNYGNPILKDTVKWEKISGIYEATGLEKYVIIGNFKNDSNTDTVNIYLPGSYPYSGLTSDAYIFVDAVAVYSINPNGALPWVYTDTTINKGDSVYIGNKMGGLHFKPLWFYENGNFIDTNAGITVSPTLTTKYYIKYTLCGVQRTDTVKVTVRSDNDVAVKKYKLLNEELKIYPVPANDELKLSIEKTELIKDFHLLFIINNLGLIIREEELKFENGYSKIRTEDLPSGVYSLQLKSSSNEIVSKRFVISR
jgi:hypothetical protein